jgi:hypothetical protein
MKKLLQTEELAQLSIALIALYFQPVHIAWWAWPLLFLSPDISLLGYLVNAKTGAIIYNIFHHKLVAVCIFVIGYFTHNDITVLCGLVAFGHSCFDRIWGYGLKYTDSFHHTHLGMIGKPQVK